MPLRFWNDEGDARYRASYFETYPDNFDGTGRGAVWRHGDWLKINTDGSCVIYGRSDATINRHGLRMGTSEIYSAIEALPEVLDSMVVDLEYLGRESYMPLFVVLREGVALDAPMQDADQPGHRGWPVPPLSPQRDHRRSRNSANAVGQEAGIADQEIAARPCHREGHQPRRDGQSRLSRLVSRIREGHVQGAGKIRHGLRRSFSANPERYDDVTGCGSSAYLCANHDDSVAGTHPTSPYRMNCTMPRIRPARAVQQFGRDEAEHADDQHAHRGPDLPDVHQDVIHRPQHQRRHDAEQIAVLQRLGEHHEQLCDLAGRDLGPVAGLVGGREQQQEAADERADELRRSDSVSCRNSERGIRCGFCLTMVLRKIRLGCSGFD